MATRVELDRRAIARLGEEHAVILAVGDVVVLIRDEVERLMPRRTGQAAGTVEADKESVGITDLAGHLIEFGSVNNPSYAPMRTAVINLGLRLKGE